MDLQNLLQNKKNNLKPTKTFLTNVAGEKFEISGGVTTKLEVKVSPFVIDTKPNLQVDSILPGLFLSSQDPIFCFDILKSYAIKHILSLGIEPDVKFDGIQYHFIEILDIPEFNLITSLKDCLKIIHQFRKDNILVHCNAGVSRSPTVVISYIMATEKLSYTEAFQKVKNIRTYIRPNTGFIQQLKALKPEDLSSNLVDN
ncbi:dual specificity protein phosphatase 19-like [Chelonus insularis]|uniref:dual specificity protein phosphatase 19-like n=1 Tax=Chelonus insularis TaxID=460826 RepID=UPI00158C0303|nr:dual specificity protein phosphatase 19-like [Chelonus insularis]